MNALNPTPQNWQALLKLRFSAGQDKTSMIPQRRYGPLSVQRAFYPEGETCHVYLLHPPGGVVGGDRLDLQVALDEQAQALLTTPGATKFYLSAGECAQVQQQFTLAQDAAMEYLPQENIYFPGALVNIKTTLDVDASSHLILWEKHCLGRPANNEVFDTGKIISRLELRADKRLLFHETQRIDAAEIQSASGLRGEPVMATLLVCSNRLQKQWLDDLREYQPDSGIAGITQPLPNLLLVRYLGDSTDAVNRYFIALLDVLRPLVLGRKPCHPRIWNT